MKSAVTLILALLSVPARAEEVTLKDIQVIGRTLGFMEDATAGTLELGIVYVRGEADSLRQATAMQAMLHDTPGAGKFILHPRLVPADELATTQGVGALFIVPAAGRTGASAAATARRLHVPVLSTDVACAQAGHCVLTFSSLPSVEITFNRSAAEETGVRFTPAFRMLVKKI